MGFRRFYWVLLGFRPITWVFTGFQTVLLGFTGFQTISIGFTGFHVGFPGFSWIFTGFQTNYMGFTGFYRVSDAFNGFSRVLLDFYRVGRGFIGFPAVSRGVTGFYWVLQGATANHLTFFFLSRSSSRCVGSQPFPLPQPSFNQRAGDEGQVGCAQFTISPRCKAMPAAPNSVRTKQIFKKKHTHTGKTLFFLKIV